MGENQKRNAIAHLFSEADAATSKDVAAEGLTGTTTGETHFPCEHCGAPNRAGLTTCRVCNKPLAGHPPSVNARTIPMPNATPRFDITVPARSGLSILGWVMFGVGVVGMVVGLSMGTTVEPSPMSVYGQSLGSGSVHNIGMIATKLTVLIAAGFAAVSGTVLISASAQTDAARLLRFSVERQLRG
jgi:hypothetical protein